MAGNYPPYSGQTQDLTGVPEDWAIEQGGIEERYFQRDIVLNTADGAGALYAIMQGLPAGSIITELKGEVQANANMTSVSVGLFDSDTNAVISANCYASAVNVAAGANKNTPFDLLAALTFAQTKQRAKDLAVANGGTVKGRYDLVLTNANAPSAQINFTIRGRVVNSV